MQREKKIGEMRKYNINKAVIQRERKLERCENRPESVSG